MLSRILIDIIKIIDECLDFEDRWNLRLVCKHMRGLPTIRQLCTYYLSKTIKVMAEIGISINISQAIYTRCVYARYSHLSGCKMLLGDGCVRITVNGKTVEWFSIKDVNSVKDIRVEDCSKFISYYRGTMPLVPPGIMYSS